MEKEKKEKKKKEENNKMKDSKGKDIAERQREESLLQDDETKE